MPTQIRVIELNWGGSLKRLLSGAPITRQPRRGEGLALVVPLAGSRPHALAVVDTGTAKPLPAQRAFDEGLARVTALGRRVVVETPDAYFNAGVGASCAAMYGLYIAEGGQSAFVHGGTAWRNVYPGWRVMDGATAYGWHDLVATAAKYHGDRQVCHPMASARPGSIRTTSLTARPRPKPMASARSNPPIPASTGWAGSGAPTGTTCRPSSSTSACATGGPPPIRPSRSDCCPCWNCTCNGPRTASIPTTTACTKATSTPGPPIRSGTTAAGRSRNRPTSTISAAPPPTCAAARAGPATPPNTTPRPTKSAMRSTASSG